MAAFENLEFPQWSAKTKEHTLTGRIFNGAISFTVWPKERGASGGKPLASVTFDKGGQGYLSIMKLIAEISKAPLGTKMPMSKTNYNFQTKQVSNVWVLTMEKDSEMCWWITISDCEKGGGTPYRFPIMAPRTILIGSEPPSKAGQSDMGIHMFKNWLTEANHYAPTTANKQQFGKGGQGGGYQRPAGGPSPASATLSAAVASDTEDVPF